MCSYTYYQIQIYYPPPNPPLHPHLYRNHAVEYLCMVFVIRDSGSFIFRLYSNIIPQRVMEPPREVKGYDGRPLHHGMLSVFRKHLRHRSPSETLAFPKRRQTYRCFIPVPVFVFTTAFRREDFSHFRPK